MDYNWLSQELERQRQKDIRLEARTRREYAQQGIDYSAIQAAQRAAFSDAMRRTEEMRRVPVQLELPGVAPSVLEQVRYKGLPMTPQEQAAAGIYGVGWQQTPEYPGRQMTLDEMLPSNSIRELVRPDLAAVVEQMAQQPAKRSASGRQMAMRWGLPALGGGLGIYALAGAMGDQQQGQQEVRYA